MKLHHFNPKKQKRGLLYQVFVAVALIQVSLLVAFSTYIVSQTISEDDGKFTPPQTVEKVDPAQQEHRVRVERQQRKSSKMTRRISIQNPQNVNTPEVKINLPSTISQGGGISTITDKTMNMNMNIAVTTIDLMGLKSKAEKILICLDAGPYLMTDVRGGLDTYKVIREEIKNLINGLPSTALFNLMAFDVSNGTTINVFQSNLVAATAFNKRIAGDWINPINTSLKKIGPGRNNYKLKYEFLPQPPASGNYNPGASNIYRIYQAALEQGAEAVWILTTGWVDPDRIMMPWTDSEIERYRRAQERYESDKEKQLKAQGWTDEKQQEYERAAAEARARGIKKAREWIKSTNAAREQKGLPLYTGTPEQAMRENKFMDKVSPAPPPVKVKAPEARFKPYGRAGIFKYYQKLFKEVYFEKQMKAPVINMIVFRGKDEDYPAADARVVKAFCSANQGGRSRVLKGLKAVAEKE